MKPVKVTSSGLEADMMAGYLRSNGVTVVVQGSKEYASIITGADLGHYRVMVPKDEHDKAIDLLGHLQSSADSSPDLSISKSSVDEASTPIEAPLSAFSLLKRSIMFAIMGALVLPIAFHFGSIYYLRKLLRSPNRSVAHVLWAPIIMALNIVGLYVWYRLYLD